MKAIYLLNPDAYARIYGQAERDTIAALVDIVAPPQTATSVREDSAMLESVEAIFSGWGRRRAARRGLPVRSPEPASRLLRSRLHPLLRYRGGLGPRHHDL